MRKYLVTFLGAVFMLVGSSGAAFAQGHGGGGGGGFHGGGGSPGMSGGGWHGGGGGWHGGGGGWQGGGGWHGGGWHGGSGWHGGWGGWHGNFGVFVGVPGAWWWPAYYPYYGYPYYYGNPYYAYDGYPYYGGYYGGDPGQTVYIQQQPGAVQAAPQQYSYYCTDPAGYYPQVPNCNKPWLRVVPDGSPQPTPLPQ